MKPDGNEVRDLLRAKVRALFEELEVDGAFGDSESLFRSGRLDSLAAIKLASYMETKLDARFDQVRFDISKIDSIDAMCAFLENLASSK